MITALLTLAFLGLIVYIVVTYIPMPPLFKQLIIAVCAIFAILYIMRIAGLIDIPIR